MNVRKRKTRIYRADRASKSAKTLGKLLSYVTLSRRRAIYEPRATDNVINWGATTVPAWWAPGVLPRWVNSPDAVSRAVDKLACFKAWRAAGLPAVEFTEDRGEAQEWVDAGDLCVVRKLLRASTGDGIVLVREGRVPRAPLYTRYFKGMEEYRVHVAFGKVIDIQEKRRRTTDHEESVPHEIRNLANGWVFCREGITAHKEVTEGAVEAISTLGLDFGAIDIKRKIRSGAVGLLECNTAPGLEGSTGAAYAAAFRQWRRTVQGARA